LADSLTKAFRPYLRLVSRDLLVRSVKRIYDEQTDAIKATIAEKRKQVDGSSRSPPLCAIYLLLSSI
jgi:hypothetical protein